MKRVALLVVALAAFLTGCNEGAPVAPADPSGIVEPAPLNAASRPGDLVIPKLNVASTLIPLGKRADGSHDTPPLTSPGQAGWYEPGPEPGQPGPAIILGHVNGGGQPGVFAGLNQLTPGDTISVGDLKYEVYRVAHAPKAGGFPAQEVYAPTPGSELRLITCDGNFVGGELGYEDNWIVYAREI